MATTCDCCGCIFESDYGTTNVTGTGTHSNPYVVSKVEPTWIRPAARVRRTTNQSIATGAAFAAITHDTPSFDTGNFWSASFPTRLVIPQTGLYLFGGSCMWQAAAAGTREIGIRLNGTTVLQLNDQPTDATSGATNTPWQSVGYQYRLSIGDYLELVVRQESAGALIVQSEFDDSPAFWIVYLGKTI